MHGVKKRLSFLLPLVLIVLLSACVQTNQETSPENTASDLPELKIGVDTLKPFFYLDENGAYAGIDAEVATEACRRAGYTPVFTEIPWSERSAYLSSGRVDCLWTAFIEDGREEDYLWSTSYLYSKLAVIVDEQCPDQSLQDFRSKVAVRAGSRAEEMFRNGDGLDAEIYSCGTFDMAKTAFIKGYAGALAGHEIVLRQIMENAPGIYRFLSDEMMPVRLAVAFDKADDTGRCQAISDAICTMKQDGTLTSLAENYQLDQPGQNDQEGGTPHAEADE